MSFTCGCSIDAPGDYCDEHQLFTCHTVAACGGPDDCSEGDGEPCPVVEGECPPCRRRRWLGVGLGVGTQLTKTRHYRKEDMKVMDDGPR